MKVVEKFVSINGESVRAGELAVFIRFRGCNLNCSYCDTAWANAEDCEYEEMTPVELANYVESTGIRNVTLTGGEPLLQKELKELIERLLEIPYVNVEIETNGSVDIADYVELGSGKTYDSVETVCENRLHFTLDYKLPSSGCEDKMLTSNYRYLDKEDAVKFVVGDEADLYSAKAIIDDHGLCKKCKVYLSPVFGKIKLEKMVEFMTDNRMNNVKLQIQMHKVIWNPDKRGV